MMLLWLILVLLIAGVIAFVSDRGGRAWGRYIALGAIVVDLVLWVLLLQESMNGDPWFSELYLGWVPRFGIGFRLGMDGLSLLLVLLTLFLGLMAVAASWSAIRVRIGFFYFNLLWTLAGIVGVFTALDLFLFFFFWELMLVPMYFIIAVWGYERRIYAANKFFLFTQGSGLLMLIAILALAFAHHRQTGILTFDYFDLLQASLPPGIAVWLMLGFLVAFFVKLPAVLFHPWLPDAHTEAPTAGSVILAGVLLKTGAYGLLRFVIPLFPTAVEDFAYVAMVLGVIGILYGAILAIAQNDLKRLVAYTSISHMGFVLLGIFAWTELALQGAVIQMVAHGLSTGALFMLVGLLQERLHTRDLTHMGGLWAVLPRLAALGLFFAVAALGLPGLGNFVGEFLVLLGAFPVSRIVTVLGATGLILAAVYALLMVQRAFHGPLQEGYRGLKDLSFAEMAPLAVLVVALVWLGLYPQPVIDAITPSLLELSQGNRFGGGGLP